MFCWGEEEECVAGDFETTVQNSSLPLFHTHTPPAQPPHTPTWEHYAIRCPEVLPDDATDLVKRLLRRNPSSRLGAGPLSNTDPDIPSGEPTAGGATEGQAEGGGGGRRDGGGGGFVALKAHPFFRGLEFVGDGQVYVVCRCCCSCCWCVCCCCCRCCFVAVCSLVVVVVSGSGGAAENACF